MSFVHGFGSLLFIVNVCMLRFSSSSFYLTLWFSSFITVLYVCLGGVQMLLPIGSSSELFSHPPPLFPTSRLYNIRPYHSKDKVGSDTHTYSHFTHNSRIIHRGQRCFRNVR